MTNEPPPYPGEPHPDYATIFRHTGSTPPPPGGYPATAAGGSRRRRRLRQTPYSAPDAIGYGWRKFKENAGIMIVATLIVAPGRWCWISFGSHRTVTRPVSLSDGFDFERRNELASLVAQTITGTVGYVLAAC